MTLIDDLYEIHVTWLEGLGASYRIKGYFLVENAGSKLKIDFDGVAFGGNFGGHNINVQISDEAKSELTRTKKCKADEIEGLISEVQRRMLNNEMIVEYDKLKPETDTQDQFGNLKP